MNPRDKVDIYLKLLNKRNSGLFFRSENFIEAEKNFIESASCYVKSNYLNCAYEAFLQMGVSVEILRKAKINNTSMNTLEKEFIEKGKPYIGSENISHNELRQGNVPARVLEAAGISTDN